jgi:hypothetical protein
LKEACKKAADRVRVNVELTHALNDAHLWGDVMIGSRALQVVAHAIFSGFSAAAIRAALTPRLRYPLLT